MAPRITLITGCSSGIGLSTAVALATDPDHGYIVYATMRNLAKKEPLVKAAGGALDKTLFITHLDVTDEASIKKAMKQVTDKHGRIDVLINNAAYGWVGFIELASKDQMRAVFETNFFGAVTMMQEVIPFMKRQRSGRILNISTSAAITALPFVDLYVATKYALEGITESLAMSLRPFNIWVSSFQPGIVTTDFQKNLGSANNQPELAEIQEMDIDADSKEIFKAAFAHMTGPMVHEVQTPEEVAEVIVGSLASASPHLRYPTSPFRLETAKKYFVDPTGDSYINSVIPHITPDSLKKK